MTARGQTNAKALCALLSVEEMSRADQRAVARGTPGITLMENAGRVIYQEIIDHWSLRPTVVLCGPGNNGGDGFVVARLLAEHGWPVKLALIGMRDKLTGDAALAAMKWQGPVDKLDPDCLHGAELVVDALFGAGLDRPIEGVPRAVIEALEEMSAPIVAIDMPSGVHGDTGAVMGVAPRADLTVTFFRKKTGHLLLPGALHCGRVRVGDIGIGEEVLTEINPKCWENDPAIWLVDLPWPKPEDHKYARGHAIITGGGRSASGAGRLAARAALRVGAGVVTAVCVEEAVPVYSAHLTAVMVHGFADLAGFQAIVSEARVSAILLGPGNGVTPDTRAQVLAAASTGKPLVLDADALTVFAAAPHALFDKLKGPCLITPHDGEFQRLFETVLGAELLQGSDYDRVDIVRRAAHLSGVTILLKGAATIIAAPDGRVLINVNGPPSLATAGSGDVLAGFATGLIAQGMAALEAAGVAAWLHGAAAQKFGPGLIAEDISECLPAVLRELAARK